MRKPDEQFYSHSLQDILDEPDEPTPEPRPFPGFVSGADSVKLQLEGEALTHAKLDEIIALLKKLM